MEARAVAEPPGTPEMPVMPTGATAEPTGAAVLPADAVAEQAGAVSVGAAV